MKQNIPCDICPALLQSILRQIINGRKEILTIEGWTEKNNNLPPPPTKQKQKKKKSLKQTPPT